MSRCSLEVLVGNAKSASGLIDWRFIRKRSHDLASGNCTLHCTRNLLQHGHGSGAWFHEDIASTPPGQLPSID